MTVNCLLEDGKQRVASRCREDACEIADGEEADQEEKPGECSVDEDCHHDDSRDCSWGMLNFFREMYGAVEADDAPNAREETNKP